MIRSLLTWLALPTYLLASPQLGPAPHPLGIFIGPLFLVGLAAALDQVFRLLGASRRIGMAGVVVAIVTFGYLKLYVDQPECGDLLFSSLSDQAGLVAYLVLAGGLAILGDGQEKPSKPRRATGILIALGLLGLGWDAGGIDDRYGWVLYRRANSPPAVTLLSVDEPDPPKAEEPRSPTLPMARWDRAKADPLVRASLSALYPLTGVLLLSLVLYLRGKKVDGSVASTSPRKFWLRAGLTATLLALAWGFFAYSIHTRMEELLGDIPADAGPIRLDDDGIVVRQ